jgi:alkylation response protein AidB-like acyl-CoA dehydrogenase
MELALTEEQRAIDELFSGFFEKECPPERVRAAEPLGFDAQLWSRFAETGACGMGLPENLGGSAASALDAALIAEAQGRALAPLPFIEHFVASRLLAHCDAAPPDDLAEGAAIATLALRAVNGEIAPLVPAGAVARHVLALVDGELVLTSEKPPGRAPENFACLPISNRAVGVGTAGRRVLADGDEAQALFEAACDEWRALTSAALVGLSQRAFEIGLDYTKEREQFGRLIGSFQALQHGLADVAVLLDGARLLARKAAWAFDEEPEEARRLAGMALVFCGDLAPVATSRALHYHGGVGFSLEYDIQLYYRRAKGWLLVLNDPALEVDRLGEVMFGSPLEAR